MTVKLIEKQSCLATALWYPVANSFQLQAVSSWKRLKKIVNHLFVFLFSFFFGSRSLAMKHVGSSENDRGFGWRIEPPELLSIWL